MTNNRGFTLVELMAVVVIIGILTALAYPSYMNSVYRANRAEAKSWLTDTDQRLQRCYSTYGSYTSNNCQVYTTLSGAGVISKDRGFYKITISSATANSYQLDAAAIIAPQTNDTGCTTMSITSKGDKTPATCW